MEGSSSSISSKMHDSDFHAGLAIVGSADSCPSDTDFDLMVKSFGNTCDRCDGTEAQIITLSTKRGPGLIDPRDLPRLTTRIGELMCKDNSSRLCICGVEALFLWNDSMRVKEFLIGIDEDFKRKGARAFLILREDALPIEDLRMLREIPSH